MQEVEERAGRAARQRVLARGAALRKRRAHMGDFMYTVPFTPTAGQKVCGCNPDCLFGLGF
jgi:hypothetical protein